MSKPKAHEPADAERGGWPGPSYVEARVATAAKPKSKPKSKPSRAAAATDEPAAPGGEG